MQSKIIVFIDRTPSISIFGGVVHFTVEDGLHVERTMAPETLQALIERGGRVLERYRRGERDVYEGG